ncbi:zinc finger protein 541 [Anomaloglossus baeobatrachus]|uniref:zinc finger protein 541 n=1 Tax=Anomaloglossus baeobatrachus TaxID=238106 RepID=UPI003F50966F
MSLYSLCDEHGLQPDDFCREVFQPISDLFQPPALSLGSCAAILGDNLEDIPLPCRMEEISSDADLLSSVTSKWDADLNLRGAESSPLVNKPCNEKRVQTTTLDCKVCGKVFSSLGSLNKHLVNHSQERSHICKICTKAFKRQGHLMGHMLTHLKVKPFVCTEPGCSKSYCDFRSLRRHSELHHGLWTNQPEAPAANPALAPSTVLEPVPGPPVLPNDELIRCLVTEILQQNVTSNMAVLQDTNANHGPQTMTLDNKWSEDFTTRNTYTMINSTSKLSMDPDYARYCDPSPDPPLYPARIWSILDQPDIHSTGTFGEATVNGEFKDPFAKHPYHLDHRYASPAANNGHEASQAQYSLPQEADFTGFTIQLCPNPEFQIQNPTNFYPAMTNFQSVISHTATLSLPSMSVPQCYPETTGIRGWGEPQRDPQGVPTVSRIIGAAEDVGSGSQNGATLAQPGQESSKSGIQSKARRSQSQTARKKEAPCPKPSTIPASQVALESFTALNKSQGNEKINRFSICKQKDIQEWDIGRRQHKEAPIVQSLDSGTWTTMDTTAGHLVIPVSVPVTKKDDKVNGFRGHLQKPTTKKGKKTRPCPKPLYIPPPVLEKNCAPSGCFQSSMRSPDTPLTDYLQKCALHPQYTPPPMLSPIRQGTGLYFHTFCAPSSAKCQPPSIYDTDIDGICLVRDTTEFSVQPHINIGDRFQAVIPECRVHTMLEGEEEKADLVWRPRIHTAEMSHFVNLACSSAVPGGGCNMELALHCLHFSQGDILEALDKLLIKEHQKILPGCLVDYHYAGSDHWSVTEKRQFKNAYYKERKNFSYIQAMIPGKSISQCVEYYYTAWKTNVSSERRRTPAPGHALRTEQGSDTEEPRGEKASNGRGLRSGVRPLYVLIYICSSK